ncbi:unnamed protein product [Clavelina lepadiformis]|uniref:Uncharacterized protein n=1 Tax=Clavelina lepadiformis TaxID=159417 RepID=A0ABP0FR18_CLALP
MFFLSIVLLIGCIGLGIHRIRTRRRLNRLRHQLISLRELDITSDQSRKPHVATPDVFTKEPCLMVHCEVKNQTHSSVVTKLKTYDEGSLRSGKES